MATNIACFVPGCKNPVIGQCQGHKGTCGRFYCAEHSVSALCADCAKAKLEDDMVEDYFNTAEQLKREAKELNRWRGCAYLFVIALVSIMLGASASTESAEAALGAGFGVFYCGAIGLVIWDSMQKRNYEKAALSQLNETKPGFPEFYRMWKKEKNKEALKTGLAVAAGIVLAGTAAAIGDSISREERVRDIEEGVRRASR